MSWKILSITECKFYLCQLKIAVMRSVVIFIFLLWDTVLFAQENKTKLVVGITVNNFYPEWLSMYAGDLSEGGLKRITGQGKRLIADYNYLFSQTGVDQATIYTGLLPSEHGIVSHEWYDRLRKRRQNNAVSGDHPMLGGANGEKGLSPGWLQALTLGCAMKMNNAFSKVYSISMNGEEAVLSGGSCANMAFWFSEKNGKWLSSGYYTDSLPGWLKIYNAKMESDFFIRRGWMPLENEMANNTALRLKSRVGIGSDFFYDLMQTKRKFNTYRILKATPYANTMVADLAGELIGVERLGYDNDVDLLALNFSALDYMNRDFDVSSREFRDMLIRLDKDVEKLLATLDAKVGKGNYTLFLTFSESRELLPEELGKMRLASGYFSVFKSVALLKSYLNLIYGDGEWIADYDAGQIYLNRPLIEKKELSLSEMQDKIADFLIEFEGVSRVMTANALTHNASSSGMEVLFQNSFSQKRSGDILFSLQPTWIPELKDMEDNYARYSKRNKVPLFLYGAGITGVRSSECRITDILPSLCHIIGIPAPYTAIGNPVVK